MHILILNWRDPKNPTGGGAELLTQELAKRWVKAGHKVTQISSLFKNGKKQEVIDGVTFIRMGKWWNVHFFAFFYYNRYLKDDVDIIIDEVHWFPFFSYLYAPHKTVTLVCEVANKLFFQIFPYPVAVIWRMIEKIYLQVYRNVPAMVISQSTYDDLLKEGHTKSNISILPMGLTIPVKIKHYPKEKNFTMLYVARLNKQKGIFDAIKAFALVKKKLPQAKFWIVGSAEKQVLTQVIEEIKNYKLEKDITLFGFVDDAKKFELLSRAHILVSASVQEGWGLTIPEAGLTRTPAIVYNIQGFRDIIENNSDGILTAPTPDALAKSILEVFDNEKLYKKLSINSQKKARSYSWDKSASVALSFLKKQ